ncbi:hypothetical protein, partial [Streptococcus pneumoniae]|uniref:hypothetical protein n=1 Tax=Streptococcus pneumoniae TaxID=1313 RepID=UPI001E369DF6
DIGPRVPAPHRTGPNIAYSVQVVMAPGLAMLADGNGAGFDYFKPGHGVVFEQDLGLLWHGFATAKHDY